MNRILLTLFISCIFLGVGWSQNTRLAQQYFQNGEYEKAAALYDQLYQKNGRNDFFFDRYFDCLLAMEDYDEAEKSIQKQIKRNDGNVKHYVSYGTLLERLNKPEEAEVKFRMAVDKLPADQYSVTRLANSFITQTKYDYAISTYEKGAALLKDDRIFAYNLGDLYRRKGDSALMITSYLNSLEENPERIRQLKTIFQRYLFEEDFIELQTQLYSRIQGGDDSPVFPELLAWVFIQDKDYRNALRQVKALDLRLNENGTRVFDLGNIAAADKDYDAAILAFDYIVEEKGRSSTFYLHAKKESLRAKRSRVVEGYEFTQEQLEELESEYLVFLEEFGYNRSTAAIIIELSELRALYLNDLKGAISILDELIALPGVDPTIQARAKIALADYYLMQGDVWESTLLYSQVDKTFKEDVLGHEARFRNARLAYFNGDFQWAQAQFDVLKASTSKLISNDALDLSVFILDNLGLDTTAVALQMYADAELLAFRNQFDAAFAKMDMLLDSFPSHSLKDDVFYLKGKIHTKKREYEQAAAMYKEVVDGFPEDIRADNSLFALADLKENYLNETEEAMTLYEKLFIDYSNSTFAVEARKRFRRLRGDDLN